MSKLLSSIKQTVKGLLKRHPMETLVALSSPFVFGTSLMLYIPIVILLVNVFSNIFRGKSRLMYYLLTLVVMLIAANLKAVFGISPAMYALLLSVVLLFLTYHKSSERKEYAARFFEKAELLFLAFIVLFAGLFVTDLFKINFNEYGEYASESALAVLLLVAVWICYWYKKRPKQDIYHTIFGYLLRFALPGLTLCIMIVLYIALFSFIVKGSFFSYGYMGITLLAIVLGMIVKLAEEHFEKSFFNKIYRHFPLIVIPLLIGFWIGLIEEISKYWLTDTRMLLLLGGVLLTSFVVWMLLKKEPSYRQQFFYGFILLVAFTAIPPYFVPYIGANSQAERMTVLAGETGMVDEAGNLVGTGKDYWDKEHALLRDAHFRVMMNLDYVADEKARDLANELQTKCRG